MKTITFVCLTFVVLSIGCFDGGRGILTELLPDAAPPVPARVPLTAEIAVGTGSELVMSPVPPAIEDALWGSWDKDLDSLEHILSLPGISPTVETESTVGSSFTPFCEHVHRRLFYDKYIDADGIAILAPSDRTSHANVDDEYLFATREIILTMTSKRRELREVMSPENGFRYVLVGVTFVNEVNMPRELRRFGEWGGSYGGGLATGGVEWHHSDWVPALYSDIVVHEWAHAIDDAFDRHPHLFPDWGMRLRTAYSLAYQKALQGNGFFDDPSQYALKNEREYWAVGATVWFLSITGGDIGSLLSAHGDNLANELQRTRQYELQRTKMLAQDPLLYALLNEVFPVADMPPVIRIAAE